MTTRFRSIAQAFASTATLWIGCLCWPQTAGAQETHVYSFEEISGNRIAWSCAGIGNSTFSDSRTRRFSELTDELHKLALAQNWASLVLVAHSFGGFIARAYAAKYSDDVSGILFLDSMQEDWLPRLKAE